MKETGEVGQAMKILIVEDNEDSRMILKKNLETVGHTVKEAFNGAEALKAAKESPPDMIVSDILMPVMDGFRLCREIKQDKQLCKTPFVFYTATYIGPKDEKLAMSIGASRYIIKPADTAEFLRTIKGVFQEYEEEKLPVPEKPVKEETELFRMYEESIARKLDKKVEELERVKTNLVIAYNELKESEEKFRIIFDNAIDGILLADMKTRKFHTGNKMICRMLGYSLKEIKKLEVGDIHPEKVLPHVIERFEKQLKGELAPAEDIPVKKKDGALFYANINSSPITLVGKRYLMSTFRDITWRRQAEEELLRSRSELSALFRVSSAISRTMDLEELFCLILDTVTGLEILNLEPRGGILIIEGERLNLVSHLGYPDAFVDQYKSIKIGSGPFGTAAKTGEIIVSENSVKGIGHLVIPLKVRNQVLGVLSLHSRTGLDLDDHKSKILLTIGNQVGVTIDHARLYEETKKLSLLDPLTGLANRRFMDIVLERSFARAKRLERQLSALMLDIDYFKNYNDTYGHAAGDTLLVKIAKVILKETRGIDLVVRYGGEEFLILLPETGLPLACEVAERIRKSVKAKIKITVSLGISSYHEGMKKKKDLIKKADEALYQAKQNGRNRIEVSG